MSRDPYIDQRLINWGRWKAGVGAGGLGYASTAWESFDSGDRYTTRAPVLPDGEDAITDLAIRSLPEVLQAALDLQYVQGGTAEVKAVRAGCHVQTFRARVNAAVRGVSAWLAQREHANLVERERVEKLQQAKSEALAVREQLALTERARTDAILGIRAKRVRRAL